MLTREYIYKGIKMKELHYIDDLEKTMGTRTQWKGIDVLKVYQTKINYKNSFQTFNTLHINLQEETEEEIFKKFKSNYRNEINKNMRDDEVVYQFVNNPSFEEIEIFLKDLKTFSEFKGYHVNYDFEWGRSKDFMDNIVLTYVRFKNEKVASHMYYVDGKNRARLKSSVFYRMDEEVDPKLAGRSNKGLHWFDIREFKKLGIAIYDFGGAIRIDDKGKILGGGISGFKKGFSNNLVIEYNGEIPLTIKGKIVIAVWKFLKKRRK